MKRHFPSSDDLPSKVVATSVVDGVLTQTLKPTFIPVNKKVSFLMYDLPHCMERGELKPVSTRILDGDDVDKELLRDELNQLSTFNLNHNNNANE